jgi:hypothetical protein
MRTAFLSALLALSLFGRGIAQEHLEPEVGVLSYVDAYRLKVSEVFAPVLTNQVVCKVVILESFEPEKIVGLRRAEHGLEAFSLTPSSTIWDIEAIHLYESGRIETWDTNLHKLTLEENKSYQALKKSTPADYRSITVATKSVPIDEALGNRIAIVWESMLMAVRYPEKPSLGLDGTTYHFSIWISGRGVLNGKVWSPAPKTKTAALVDLVDALTEYATGRLDAAALKKTVSRVEKGTKR